MLALSLPLPSITLGVHTCIGTSVMLASQFMHMPVCVTGKGSFGLFQLRRSLGFMAFTKKTLTVHENNYIALIRDCSLDTFQLPTENICC